MHSEVHSPAKDGRALLRYNGCRRARNCPAGTFLLARASKSQARVQGASGSLVRGQGHALVQHSAMEDGLMEPSSCPEGFEARCKGRSM